MPCSLFIYLFFVPPSIPLIIIIIIITFPPLQYLNLYSSKMAEATAKGSKGACSPPHKKQRTDDCSDAVDSTTDQGCVGDRDPHFLTTFKDFEVVRVLNNDEKHNSVVMECLIKGKEGVAVAHLQVCITVFLFIYYYYFKL